MYVDSSTVKTSSGKLHTRHLLRESFRENGQVRHRTIANLSHCSPEEIGAIKLALRHKQELENLGSVRDSVTFRQGLSFGAVWVVYEVALRLGIVQALGSSRDSKLALWQVIARVIDQGSRLSAVRLAASQAACDVLGLGKFDEDDLYENLDWLAANQGRIEDMLYARRRKESEQEKQASVFLYDVTSSYFEGTHNELAQFGYNRDKKSGKRQIVIGLLCDSEGCPLSIEVFAGNTSDTKTVTAQIEKVKERFGAKAVTFVGDRGMLKSEQIEDLCAQGFHYITAITKPQIEKLLKEGVFQMSLFDKSLAEITDNGGPRYVLRRNPVRAAEVAQSREEKLSLLRAKTEKANEYLAAHKRANTSKALTALQQCCKKLGLSDWCTLTLNERSLVLSVDEDAKKEAAALDGCYVLKTDLTSVQAPKEMVHDRYKDLALVERAFRSSKTVHLEMRPIYLQLAEHTKGHAFVVMLAYKIIQHLARCWREFDLTVEEALQKLATLCLLEVSVKNTAAYNQVPTPRKDVAELLDAAKVKLPKAINASGVKVSTKKKLQSERKP
jgi:hypothetical protein